MRAKHSVGTPQKNRATLRIDTKYANTKILYLEGREVNPLPHEDLHICFTVHVNAGSTPRTQFEESPTAALMR
jgi:hypothetical protein